MGPLYRGGAVDGRGSQAWLWVLCVEGVSRRQGLLDWELDFIRSVEVPLGANAVPAQLLLLTRGLKNS